MLSRASPFLSEAELAHTAKLLEYSFTIGFMLGGFTAGRQALLQHQAEHQHILPQLRKRSQWIQYLRNRNYRTMAAFGVGGVRRGAQMTAVGLLYSVVRHGLGLARSERPEMGWNVPVGSEDVAAGMVVGALFAYAGRGHRLYYLRKGIVFGGVMGGILAMTRMAVQ